MPGAISQVPRNKRLVVQYIASSVDTPTALIGDEFSASGGFIQILYGLQGTDPVDNKVYSASRPMLYCFEAGQYPLFPDECSDGTFQFHERLSDADRILRQHWLPVRQRLGREFSVQR